MLIKLVSNGKEINLTGDNTIIKSNNFNVDKNGNMNCIKATLEKGKLEFYKSNDTWVATFKVGEYINNQTGVNKEALGLEILESTVPTFTIRFKNNAHNVLEISRISTSELSNISSSSGYTGLVEIGSALKASNILVNTIQPSTSSSPQINFTADIYTPNRVLGSEFVNVSEKKLKENIYKLKENSKKKTITRKALDIVKNTDICEYNFRGKEHKQIGVVIGKNYKTPDEILSEDGKGIDLYSMISTLYRAFQENIEEQEKMKEIQNKEIQTLKEKIKRLEEKQ